MLLLLSYDCYRYAYSVRMDFYWNQAYYTNFVDNLYVTVWH